MAGGSDELERCLETDRGACTDVIVVVCERLTVGLGILRRQEPLRIDTFWSDLAVEHLNEAVVGPLTRAVEVQDHAVHEGPEN